MVAHPPGIVGRALLPDVDGHAAAAPLDGLDDPGPAVHRGPPELVADLGDGALVRSAPNLLSAIMVLTLSRPFPLLKFVS